MERAVDEIFTYKIMNTYIIDWGAGADGGRYALVQAETIQEAIVAIDGAVGWPFKIGVLVIPMCEGARYVDIDPPKKPYFGKKLSSIRTKWVDDWIKEKGI